MLTNRISVVVVGCGGTGSAVLSGLPYLHHALLAAGHPSGLQVYAIDGDRISETNCVRQPFSSSEISLYKVHALIQRLNVFWGLDWAAVPTHVRYGRDLPDSDFLISCVDTRAARATLARVVRLKSRRFHYWLDLGNNASSGQFVLGEPLRPNRKGPSKRLPCVDELFPQIVKAKLDGRDSLPACSAAESLVRQEPYINTMLAQHALAMLARLFRHGELAFHGGFVSQETGRVNPLPIDPIAWARIQSPRPRLQVSMRDIRVTQVCGKGDEVTRNRFALRRALLRARVAKGVPKVMNARLARPSRASARKPKNPAERVTHHAGGDPTISRR